MFNFHVGNSYSNMDGSSVASDQVIAELIGMGFEFPQITEAIEAVGPSLDAAIEFILDDSHRNVRGASSSSNCLANSTRALGKRAVSSSNPSGRMRQSRLVEHLQSAGGPKRSKPTPESDALVSGSEFLARPVERPNDSSSLVDSNPKSTSAMCTIGSYCKQEEDIGPDWEQRVKTLLHKHFGYSSLKRFQKEALTAWLAHQDCLVLAATGAGIYIFGLFLYMLAIFYLFLFFLFFFICFIVLEQLCFCREIFVFPDSGITHRKGCSCDFPLDKFDA